MDIYQYEEEIRSIMESIHCSGCDDPECDFGERLDEAMERLLEFEKEVDNETISIDCRSVP